MRTWFRNVCLATTTIAAGHVRHALVLRADVPPQGVHAALRVPRAAGAGPAAVPRVPPLRPDDLHRLRQVRPRLPGGLHLHRQGEDPAAGKGFVVTGFKIDYTKCMFCALCVDPCPVDCIFMGSNYDLSMLHAATGAWSITRSCRWRWPGGRRRSTRRPCTSRSG